MIGEGGLEGAEFQKTPPLPSLLYSSRRKFLTSAGKCCIETPIEFQTRRQARRKTMQKRDHLFDSIDEDDDDSIASQVQSLSLYVKNRSSFAPVKKDLFQNLLPNQKKKSMIDSNNNALSGVSLGARRIRRAGKHALGVVVLESSEFDANQDNWREERSAGVNYWIHKGTGEIVTECPWLRKKKSLIQLSNSRKRLIQSPMSQLEMNSPEEFQSYDDPGTGALVYDRSEVDELFQLLDFMEQKKSVSAANTPQKKSSDFVGSPLSVRSI